MRTQGIVEYVDHTSTGGIKIKVNGTSYSAFDTSKVRVSPGDYVDFEFTEKPGTNKMTGAPVTYRNIKGSVMGVPQGGSAPVPPTSGPMRGTVGGYVKEEKPGTPILDTQRLILRQNALTAAVNYCNGHKTAASVLDVIEIAKIFEAYTSGDDDLKEVQNSLDNDE
jgi:hypothetical protein